MDLYSVKLELNELKHLIDELKKLILENNYLPKNYDREETSKRIKECDIELSSILSEELQSIIFYKENYNLSIEDVYRRIDLDKQRIQLKILSDRKMCFNKYKILNERIIELSNYISRKSYNDSLNKEINEQIKDSSNMQEVLDCVCLKKLNVPFLVALLVNDPSDIYNKVLESLDCSDEYMLSIRNYIETEKRRLDNNFVLSDNLLINLLESTTGKNIIAAEEINRRDSMYKNIADSYCNIIYSMPLLTTLTKNKPQEIINKIESFIAGGNNIFNLSRSDINNLKNYIFTTYRYLESELNKEAENIAIQGRNGLYNVRKSYGNGLKYHSLYGRDINSFMSGSYPRLDSSIEVSRTDSEIFASFYNISEDNKKNIIRTIINNLKICISMFNSYYISGDVAITNTIKMIDGTTYKTNQPLDEKNINHLLGIPKTHKNNEKQLPDETLKILFGCTNIYKGAKDVLYAIINHEEELIDSCGCFKDQNGVLHELLPWSKILLKTNAFIRGDFFESSSIITSINPNSYLINPTEKINLLSLTGTSFKNTPANHDIVNLRRDEDGRLLFGQYDMICKGMVSSRMYDSEFNIDQVVTNESFVGERLRKTDGRLMHTMNKLGYLLENVDPESGSLIKEVYSANGLASEKTISEIAEQIIILLTTIPESPGASGLCKKLSYDLEYLINSRKQYKNNAFRR